jgi:hypothetical protein
MLYTVVLNIGAFLKKLKFIVNFNVFGVGKTFEDWLKSDKADGMTKAKDKARGTRLISPFTILFDRS